MNIYTGKSVFGGIAIGRICVFSSKQTSDIAVPTENIDNEKTRFFSAVRLAKEQLDELSQAALKQVGSDSAEIFEIHKMMLEDTDYIKSVIDIIESEKVNAEYAVYRTGKKFAEIFSSMDNEYMRGRSSDVTDISQRVISNLSGAETIQRTLTEPSIIVAEDITPSETIQFDRSKILAFVTEKGSASSHTAILAGVMNIPAIVSSDIPVDRSLDGHIAAVDAYSGKIYLDPDNALLTPLKQRLDADKRRMSELDGFRGVPTRSADGKTIMLYANIGSPDDVNYATSNDAEGIGLFRSEFLFIGKKCPPDEETQFEAYKKVAEAMHGKQVIIRTFDIGADKQAEYINFDNEENPALGVRGIRLNLLEKELFKTQLRAIHRASVYGNIAIMYPMIISESELIAAKNESFNVRRELMSQNIPVGNVKEGIMIETPAAAVISDVLAKEADFFSIGTNDLTQYTLAADRQNPNLGTAYDPFHPALFRMIQTVCENAHKNGIWAGVCGELAGNPEAAVKLVALGVDELSVSPTKILPIRKTISECSVSSPVYTV